MIIPVDLLNVKTSQEICFCNLHHGQLLRQIDAQLPNGKPIRIMQDGYGWHVAVGDSKTLGDFPCPGPVSEEEMLRKIEAAMYDRDLPGRQVAYE